MILVLTKLADMINWWLLLDMKMAVGKPEYKTIIESELKITCIHNEIAMEVMWGIQHLMYRLVPHETVEVAKEDRLPMSQGLQMLLSTYGFDVKPEMVNDQIVKTAGALFKCDVVDDDCSPELREASLSLKKTSAINCEDWSLLKLATALKVIFRPEEEKGDNYRKVLSEDELLKLKDEAPKLKYLNTLSQYATLAAYDRLWSAYRVRTQKKKMLESLIKKAKEAYEAGQAQACEKGKVHGESYQIPQEHVNELPLLKGLKRSRDSGFEPIVLSKSTFVEGLSIGETGGKRIARISGAQSSTSKAIVPYKPFFPHAVLLNSCDEKESQHRC